jgi:hypothetical protein
MTHTARSGARAAAAVVGGLVGLCIGPFVGTPLGALASYAWGGYEGPGWPAQVGGALGMGAGLIGGAFLGAFLVGRPVVARWCLGAAFAVGALSFLVGFVGPILLSPDSPQGPLLGIFITGPLGLVGGAVIGLCIGLTKERGRSSLA